MTLRDEIRVSGFDGAALAAHLFRRDGLAPRALPHAAVPLVCLPGHMRPAEVLTPFIERLLARGDGPPAVLAIDHRGRGGSAPRGDAGLYTPRAEAQDMLSVLDALGWHRADVLGSGRGGLVVMASFATRPGLVRRLVLNDIGPELDGVGLARLKLSAQRDAGAPATWDEAARAVKDAHTRRYPALEGEWAALARLLYADEGGRPAPRVHAEVREHFASIDADDRYPDLWREFRAMRHVRTLLLRAEHGDMVSERTVERMREIHADLRVHDVEGQGHAPFLHAGDLPDVVGAFLADGSWPSPKAEAS